MFLAHANPTPTPRVLIVADVSLYSKDHVGEKVLEDACAEPLYSGLLYVSYDRRATSGYGLKLVIESSE